MFRVFVDVGETNVHANGLTFETVEAAQAYGTDLYRRWMSAHAWYVLEDRDLGAHIPLAWAAEHCSAYGP